MAHRRETGIGIGLRIARSSSRTTSINIVLCAKNQPKLRHLSVLKVARAARCAISLVQHFAPLRPCYPFAANRKVKEKYGRVGQRKSEKQQEKFAEGVAARARKSAKDSRKLGPYRLATVSKEKLPVLSIIDPKMGQILLKNYLKLK